MERYNRVAVVLHWLMAALILANLLLAWRFEGLTGADRGALIRVHKSIGVTLLALIVIRLVWRLMKPPPPLPPDLRPIERRAAKVVHGAFYLLMVLVPISGWVMIATNRPLKPTLVFDLFPLPAAPWLAGLSKAQADHVHAVLAPLHLVLALLIVALLVPHLAGAFKHRFLDGRRGVGEVGG